MYLCKVFILYTYFFVLLFRCCGCCTFIIVILCNVLFRKYKHFERKTVNVNFLNYTNKLPNLEAERKKGK